MSDDLVKRLRDLGDHASFEPHMYHTAADRIEELEAKLQSVKSFLGLYHLHSDADCRVLIRKALVELSRVNCANTTGGQKDGQDT